MNIFSNVHLKQPKKKREKEKEKKKNGAEGAPKNFRAARSRARPSRRAFAAEGLRRREAPAKTHCGSVTLEVIFSQ